MAGDGAERAERLVVGLVRGLHGLRGTVRVEILTDDLDRFAPGRSVYPEGSGEALTVSWSRTDGAELQVRFLQHPTRESAETLQDRYLEVDVAGSTLPPGAYYWHQIEGTPVVTVGGEVLGRVVDIFRAGGGEVYVVDGGARGEVLVPAVGAVIRELAPEAGRIVVDEVTATTVSGGLVGDFDGDNHVNGQFELTICTQ